MKAKYSVFMVLLIATILSFISCDNPFSREWAAKIGSDVITIKDLNRYYYVQNKTFFGVESNDEIDKMAQDPNYTMNYKSLDKKEFLDSLIGGKVVYEVAINDKSINQDDLDTILELQKYSMVMNYYLMKKLKNKIIVTQEEIDEYYNTNKARFSKLLPDAAESYCKREIEQRKFMIESSKYIEELKQKVGVNRDGFNEYMSKKN